MITKTTSACLDVNLYQVLFLPISTLVKWANLMCVMAWGLSNNASSAVPVFCNEPVAFVGLILSYAFQLFPDCQSTWLQQGVVWQLTDGPSTVVHRVGGDYITAMCSVSMATSCGFFLRMHAA